MRWGILGAAQIARKNWKAIWNSGNSVVTAVASRDLERCERFVAECHAAAPFERVPTALGTYESLLARPDVDAVYVPLPTGLRKEWVLRAAAAGKHVLCEKPCAIHAADLREMIGACQRQGVQFMDGVMFAHSRRLERLREVLDDPQGVGVIRRIASAFTFRAADGFFAGAGAGNIRARSDLEPLGCAGDLGWYCIRFTLWALRGAQPRLVRARLLAERGSPDSPGPIPTELAAELEFDGGVSASFFCSFVAENEQWARVTGTAGWVHLSDFVLPYFGSEAGFEVHNDAFVARGCDFNMESRSRRVSVPEYSNSHPSAQETRMIQHFAEQAATGVWHAGWADMALATQTVLDACLASARAQGRVIELG
jgi:predicted dehydrogenase